MAGCNDCIYWRGLLRCRPTSNGQCEKPRLVGRQPIQIPALFLYANLTPTRGVQRHTVNMKLVIVKACASRGKTSTLSVLIDRLLSSENFSLHYPSSSQEVTSFVIGTLNDKKVGVITFGDPGTEDDVKGCLNRCVSEGCETIFVASRTSGKLYNLLYSWAEDKGYATVETSPLFAWKYWESGLNIHKLNSTFAGMLYSLI